MRLLIGIMASLPLATASAAASPQEGDKSAGALVTQSQLMYDRATHQTRRVVYRIGAMLPRDDIMFVWRPESDQDNVDEAGRVSGRGRVVWYAATDRGADRALLAEYVGSLRAGLREGEGLFTDAVGLRISGSWKSGLPDGLTLIERPNGDTLRVTFSNGRMVGAADFNGADGSQASGDIAVLTHRGQAPAEIDELRWLLPPSEPRLVLAQAPATEVKLSVAVDRARAISEARRIADDAMCGEILGYTSEPAGPTLRIVPDSRSLMGKWKGGENIVDWPDFTCYELPERFQRNPAFVKIEVANNTRNQLNISNAFVLVESSNIDYQPAIEIVSLSDDKYSPNFSLRNFGWGAARNLKIRLAFKGKKGAISPYHERIIPSLSVLSNQSLDPLVKSLKVNFGGRANGTYPCKGEASACFQKLLARGLFSPIRDSIRLEDTRILARVEGTVSYTWTDYTKRELQRISPVSFDMVLGWIETPAEYGAPGPGEVVHAKALQFKLTGVNYRIPIPFRRTVAPNVVGRYGFALEATKSSFHKFRVAIVLSDGRQIVTRPMEMLVFAPKP